MKIFVAGGTGFLGSTVCKKLKEKKIDYCQTSLSQGTDFRDYQQLLDYLQKEKPGIIINCAAFVGGIQFGYKYPADLFRNNLLMEANILEAAKESGISRIINPISNCVYPAAATFFKEEEWWNGPLHESVMVYGMARKMFWVGAWAYNKQYKLDCINLILSNMYGPNDHFEEERSHALGALIMKFIQAKKSNQPHVICWGTGTPVREWLYIEDGADALIRALDIPSHLDPLNIGIGKGISIQDLAALIKQQTGYKGEVIFDSTKPDGAPFKTVDGSKGKQILNWEPQMPLEEGIRITIDWYKKNKL